MYITMGDLGKTYNDDDKKLLDGDIEDEDIVNDDDQMDSDADSMDSEEDDELSVNSDDVSQPGNSDIDSIDGVEETKGDDIDENNNNPAITSYLSSDDSEEEEDDDYLQKFDEDIRTNFINKHHPEVSVHNYEEVKKLATVVRDGNGTIIDQLHRTIPIMTKYESTRILGQRAKQIETGAQPLVEVPDDIIDSYIIAENELKAKKIPFIIRRPIPNGGFEYWYSYDLELLQ
jgi:DNA-directed RNA polymerase subunit K/omega